MIDLILLLLWGVLSVALVVRAALRDRPTTVDQWSKYRGVGHLRQSVDRAPVLDSAQIVQQLKSPGGGEQVLR